MVNNLKSLLRNLVEDIKDDLTNSDYQGTEMTIINTYVIAIRKNKKYL